MVTDKKSAKLSDLDDELLIGIGDLIYWWNHLEYVLENCIWGLLETDSVYGAGVTTHMSAKSKLEAIESIINIRWPTNSDRNKAFKKLLNSLEQNRKDRNDIIHGIWEQKTKDDSEISRFTARGKIKYKTKPMNKKKIYQIKESVVLNTEILKKTFTIALPNYNFLWNQET